MKSNLAILSSDQKSIDFIKKNKLSNTLNLYANSSRNTEAAQAFCKSHKFNKYYGSYEDLIYDKEVDFLLNFLPSGIKFEYIYLCLKNNIKVITDYPIISSSNDLEYFNELIESKLINNLFLINEVNFKKLYVETINQNAITYIKNFQYSNDFKNSLDTKDVLFDLCPDLFYLIYKYRNEKITILIMDKSIDKITNKINSLKCEIEIKEQLKIKVMLKSNIFNTDTAIKSKEGTFKTNKTLYNSVDLNSFVNSKNSFENLSIFTYYPYKLFQEVLYE
ncbi:Gfo/Idh/MocA family oxidoreductase [Alphaproteobacteria bacterium]|nr:Gfo/Idh/MocA family oxidoreductase [Alphaproteobacteria bacterium]